MTFVRNAGGRSPTNTALAGQSVVHVPHNVFGGNACTNGAVPKNSRTMTATTATKRPRSRPLSTRPSGNANSRWTTHGNVSQVDRRPIVYGTLSEDSVNAVNDHANPMATSAIPNTR